MYTCKTKYSKGEKKIFNNLQKQLQFILNYKFNTYTEHCELKMKRQLIKKK